MTTDITMVELKEDEEKWRAWANVLVLRYRRKLIDYPPKRWDTSLPIEQSYGTGVNILRHAHWMLERLEEFITGNEYGKFYRWLGFVQGVMASFAVYTIDEMREHNRVKP